MTNPDQTPMAPRPSACPDDLSLEAFADGEAMGEGGDGLASHIAGCAACQARLATLSAVDDLVRRAEHRRFAPRSLEVRLRSAAAASAAAGAGAGNEAGAAAAAGGRAWSHGAGTGRGPARRWVLTGGLAAAASLASVTAYRFAGGPAGPGLLAPTLFGDFATNIAGDRKLDFATDREAALSAWFAPRLPFEMPRLAALDAVDLEGGRLCFLLERRFAAIHMRGAADGAAGDGACLYLSRADGLVVDDATPLPEDGAPAAAARSGVYAAAFWRVGATAAALVGEAPPDRLRALADRLGARA